MPVTRTGPRASGRLDAVLPVLAAATVALIAAQFALAGLGAFTMVRNPSDGAYATHVTVGIATGALAWITLAAVLASRSARGHARTLRAAIALALLAIPVEPLLGEAGQHVPAAGALHAVTGLAIFVLAAWLTGATARRRDAERPAAVVSTPRASRR